MSEAKSPTRIQLRQAFGALALAQAAHSVEEWYLTHSAVPATVSLTEDGRVRLDFVNPRLDEIQVLIVAKRRPR